MPGPWGKTRLFLFALAIACMLGAVWGGAWLLLIPAALLQLANGVLFRCPRCGLDLGAYGPGPIRTLSEMNFKPFPTECPRCGRNRLDVRPGQRLRAPEHGAST